ncbi:LOW QUALITY PROTEIN: hypothetical protein HID58_017746 [Brassica napus]|uniref:Uncharacterized protein n=1 Tax=Brassica napus TaxID=3708 RepID=A0ABQ8D7Y3_BRANA|nr:LOW QUALITY PROTEIN: hypothetical protein HID58_017746 [Brassica napus]
MHIEFVDFNAALYRRVMRRVPNRLPVKTTFVQLIEIKEQSIIPGLPDDLALRCITKLSHGYHGMLELERSIRLTRAIKLEMDGQKDGCLLVLTTNELLMTLMLIGGIHCLGMELFRMDGIILVLRVCLLVIRVCYVSLFLYEEHVVVY